jgi:hypothetical protein
MWKISLYIIIGLILASCTGSSEMEPTREPTQVMPATEVPMPTPEPSDTEAPTTEPSATPMPVENLPAIQLIAGSPDTCVNAEDYSDVLGFDAIFYETTTENRIAFRMLDGEGNVLVESDSLGENKDGEESWGFYPLAYDLPENSQITMELRVYLTEDTDAPITSFSSLTYNCNTGETIESSFEQMGD